MKNNITKISMNRIDDHVNFKATNAEGNSINMDGSSAIGGKGNGVRPMETLLMGLAGCTGIDVVLTLKKMRQEVIDIQIDVEGERIKSGDATIYSTIHIHYKIWGQIKEDKVSRAINLSKEKYCSVSMILGKSASISSSFEVVSAH